MGVEPDPAKVSVMTEMSVPTNKAGVQQFQGMCQYLNEFCHNLSKIVQGRVSISMVKQARFCIQLSKGPHRLNNGPALLLCNPSCYTSSRCT